MAATDAKDFFEFVRAAVENAALQDGVQKTLKGDQPPHYKISKVGAYSFEVEWSPDERWVVTVKYSGRKATHPGGGA
jgi:hypothetical protein